MTEHETKLLQDCVDQIKGAISRPGLPGNEQQEQWKKELKDYLLKRCDDWKEKRLKARITRA